MSIGQETLRPYPDVHCALGSAHWALGSSRNTAMEPWKTDAADPGL